MLLFRSQLRTITNPWNDENKEKRKFYSGNLVCSEYPTIIASAQVEKEQREKKADVHCLRVYIYTMNVVSRRANQVKKPIARHADYSYSGSFILFVPRKCLINSSGARFGTRYWSGHSGSHIRPKSSSTTGIKCLTGLAFALGCT